MQDRRTAIWIQPTRSSAATESPAETGCGSCASPAPATSRKDATAPLLSGDPQLIARVFEALHRVREAQDGSSIVDSGRVQALDVGDGEATLTLRMGQGLCADAKRLAEEAFEALRQTLPDTDLYLRHDRPTGCAGRKAA